jgi:hypothetical protein
MTGAAGLTWKRFRGACARVLVGWDFFSRGPVGGPEIVRPSVYRGVMSGVAGLTWKRFRGARGCMAACPDFFFRGPVDGPGLSCPCFRVEL